MEINVIKESILIPFELQYYTTTFHFQLIYLSKILLHAPTLSSNK